VHIFPAFAQKIISCITNTKQAQRLQTWSASPRKKCDNDVEEVLISFWLYVQEWMWDDFRMGAESCQWISMQSVALL